jgi:GNAT superfamily N-acetyltransferase
MNTIMRIVDLKFRRATKFDLPAIVAILADDILGSSRETIHADVDPSYLSAFADIEADPNQLLCVVEDGLEIVGTFQLSFIPGLARSGTRRGQIEAVRVARNRRGEGIGAAMFAWAIEQCRARGCSLVQLTTDKRRPNAHKFYENLGFEPSHVGYKLAL